MRLFKRPPRVPLAALTIPHDAHSHLLSGVDDGLFTPASAAALLAVMHTRGTRRVSLTPHIMSGGWEGATERFTASLDTLRAAIVVANTPTPELSLGAEYMIDEALAARVGQGAATSPAKAAKATLLTATPGHVLIEMSWYGPSPWLMEVVERIAAAGLTPVLAHPERYPYMSATPEVFDRLHAAGCGFQLNLLSTTGVYGPASLRTMNMLLERGWYRHVGTDIHSPEQWRQTMDSYMDETTALSGAEAALWSLAPSRPAPAGRKTITKD